ncbi:replication termination factor 2 [Neocloeon triangulifer]|uniref:replication termination factor 2 n=1 Tax=Neocloeon triangulifer TaxID=2078957 RepID=UPI00286F3A8E|nr:replication termination factor 2 [Neocloeon triangulifer]
MGCDGGTIPKRDELVRTKKKPEQKDRESELSFRWRHCTITQQPLQNPIVACGHGRLYSKEAVLEGLLDRSRMPEGAQHITSLKDVKQLNMTPNPAFAIKANGEKGESGIYHDPREAPFVCPVIGIEFSGKFKFVFSWSCGCVISERAVKEVPSEICHKCQKPFVKEDLVYLNAEGETLQLMITRMLERKAKLKASKSKKNKVETATSSSSTTAVEPQTSSSESASTSNNTDDLKSVPSTSKPLKRARSPERAKAKDLEKLTDPGYKKAKSQYSVAKDDKASSVFKSLFTSHDTAKNQTRAHWVTYNPFYN